MLYLLVACQPDSKPEPGETTPTVTTQSGPTYWGDVRAVLDRNCARCHTDAGQSTSFDVMESVQALAPTIAAYTASGRMPPPAPDPACAEYENSDRFVLDDEEKALLAAWNEAGAPAGNPEDYQLAVEPALSTAPFDLEVFGTTSYQPEFGSDGNDYRCFQLDVRNPEVTFLTGLEAIVDNDAIVHHVVLFRLPDNETVGDDGSDPHDGFACSGLGDPTWEFIGAWAPGANPVMFPEGSGMRIPKETRFVLQMHYFESFDGADQEFDQTGYGLHFADEIDRRVYQLPYGDTGFVIPAGEANYAVEASSRWSGADMDVLGVWPHMHVLGNGLDERVRHADGTETCLFHQSDWDFHNQVWAPLVTPVTVTDGDSIDITCWFDNSAENPAQFNDPPQDVGFGEETGDEMCFGFTYVVEPE